MKVIYKQPIGQQLLDVRCAAQAAGKTVDKVVLTKAEWAEFRAHVSGLYWTSSEAHAALLEGQATFLGMTVVRGE